MIMKFKAGDLVIEDAMPWPRKGMIYRTVTGPKGRQWYQLQFFGEETTIEYSAPFAHGYLEHYKAETNENTV